MSSDLASLVEQLQKRLTTLENEMNMIKSSMTNVNYFYVACYKGDFNSAKQFFYTLTFTDKNQLDVTKVCTTPEIVKLISTDTIIKCKIRDEIKSICSYQSSNPQMHLILQELRSVCYVSTEIIKELIMRMIDSYDVKTVKALASALDKPTMNGVNKLLFDGNNVGKYDGLPKLKLLLDVFNFGKSKNAIIYKNTIFVDALKQFENVPVDINSTSEIDTVNKLLFSNYKQELIPICSNYDYSLEYRRYVVSKNVNWNVLYYYWLIFEKCCKLYSPRYIYLTTEHTMDDFYTAFYRTLIFEQKPRMLFALGIHDSNYCNNLLRAMIQEHERLLRVLEEGVAKLI
jgi:hypothetical protein